ncbi:MAG TPA: XrtA/PEP-CTERM system exopolysaccharide export protein [Micropepsaceae bacterium]|jgi:polysaccharide export outer membrane protein|nr:XrtA/PEP-CTERM system exopolysaccharide export protein [Micropepsaceae bacterium]
MGRGKILGAWLSSRALFLAGAIFGLLMVASYGAPAQAAEAATADDYLIGPGDGVQIFVWHNADLSANVAVRPDGKISIPLVEDIPCAVKTPTQLARDIEERLKKYVQDPTVTVIMSGFIGLPSQQIRIVGEATTPKAVHYRQNMSVLDAMIEVGGLSTFAAGNQAQLVRMVGGRQVITVLRLRSLLEDGDLTVNVPLQPGDIIIIPQSFF